MKNKVKILVYGEPYEWAMAHNVVETCSELGHKANIFDFTRYLYRTRALNLKNRILDRLFFKNVAKEINNGLLEAIKGDSYDILLVMKGIHLFPETIVAAKRHVCHVVNWNPDDFFNPLNCSKFLLDSFSKFDCIFTPRLHLIEEYRLKGAKRVEALHWYYLPKIQHPVSVSDEEKKTYGSDIAFVGTWSKRREQLLSSLSGFDLRIWGSHWHRASKKFRGLIDCRTPVFGVDMCKVICSSKINMNILTVENRDTTNIRNFEIPACGGFQLCERSPEIMRLFEEDKEIALYQTLDDLVDQCTRYLGDELKLQQIRQEGHKRVVDGRNTMRDRVLTIVDTLYGDQG